jgi:putative transposase
MTTEIIPNCKYCNSSNVNKYGTYKRVQRYFCKDCQHKFIDNKAIPKMQASTSQIADALNMYYEGLSLSEIRRNFIQQHNNYISRISVYNWFERFSKLAILEASKYKPHVGDIWVADETVIDIDGKNIWFWDIIDTKTRFLIASHMSYTRTSKDAEALMKQAYERTGKYPKVIYTDRLRAYLEGIETVYGGETKHIQGSPFDIENNTNMIERFHGTLKERTKVMRGLRTKASARLFLDGWLVHYNFFRPHMSLKDKTPAEVAGIKFPFRHWKDVTEQPYEKTSRIVIRTPGNVNVSDISSTKPHVAKKRVIRHRVRRNESAIKLIRARRI